MSIWVLVTSWIVRPLTAIWCEPEFFYIWVSHLGVSAKNSGWQIALIPLLLSSSRKKVSSKKQKRLFEDPLISGLWP